jgi:hypothetical protein
MGFGMARRLSCIERQLGLEPVEVVLGDEWRNGRHHCPGCRRRRGVMVGRLTQGRGRGPSETGGPGMGTADIALPSVDRVRQEPVQGGRTPAPMPARRRAAQWEEVLGQTEQGPVRFQLAGNDFRDDWPVGWFDRHASRITRASRLHTIAVWRPGPGPEEPCPEFHLTPSAHAFSNQGAFIFGHGPADWSQELRLWGLPQRLIKTLDATASLLECFQQYHLLDIVTGEAIWARAHDAVDRGLLDTVPAPIPAWPIARGTTVSVVTDDILWPERFPLGVYLGDEALDRLCNRLRQGLPRGRPPGIDRGAHASPPPVV